MNAAMIAAEAGTASPATIPPVQFRYVNLVDDTGWIRILGESGQSVYLFEYTKLKLAGSSAGRTQFEVMDGPLKSVKGSLSDANARIYLGSRAPIQTGAVLNVTYGKPDPKWFSAARGQTLNQQLATGAIAGAHVDISLNSVWVPQPDSSGRMLTYSAIPKGKYKIRLPDVAHKADMTDFYRRVAPTLKYDQVWFPIEFGDRSRYVHVGNLSEGCVTVPSLEKWALVYKALISHRVPGTDYVGPA